MRKWKKQLAWAMIVSMLAGNSLTSFAETADRKTAIPEQESEVTTAPETATSSEARNEAEDEVHAATESEIDRNELFEVEYFVSPDGSAEVKGKNEVKYDKDLKFSVTPEKGYEIEKVSANGEELEGKKSLFGLGKSWNYTVENVQERQDVEIDMLELESVRPAFSYEKEISGVTVSISAEEGVLPKGTTAKVKAVSASKERKNESQQAAEDGAVLEDMLAYDITLYDAEGEKLDNAWSENGLVKVSFSGERIDEKQEMSAQTKVLHFDENGTAEDVKDIADGEEAAIDAAHFSVFGVAFYGTSEASPSELYVSAKGNDENGDGSKEKPYQTLAKATDVITGAEIGKDFTVTLLSDIDAKRVARIYNHSVTIRSDENGPYRIYRSEKFDNWQSDSERSWYNGAMLEVGDTTTEKNDDLTLKLENIIFDDNGLYGGEIFAQAPQHSSGGNTTDNSKYVQDAMIASYAGNCEIILGDGAELKNFGGMSAVRLSGAKLTMEAGSKIIEDIEISRKKSGAKDETGAAGAVWIQGGTLNMEEDSEISGINGRAVYADGGDVNIAGTIQNIKPNDNMWQEQNGFAIHARNNANLVFDGKISDIEGNNDGIVVNCTGTNNVQLNGIIENCNKVRNVINIGKGTFNGIIRNCMATHAQQGYIFVIGSKVKFDVQSLIENCTAKIAPVYVQTNSVLDFYGTLEGNTGNQCGGIFAYSNWGGTLRVNMYDGARIVNNNGDYRGGAVISGGGNNGSHTEFYMYGGLISGNSSSAAAVYVRKNGQFYMNGGEISNNPTNGVKVESQNSYPKSQFVMKGGQIINNDKWGVNYSIGSQNYVQLNAGTIQGNKEGQISATGGSACNEYENIKIASDVVQKDRTVKTSLGLLTLDEEYPEVSFGQPSKAAINEIAKQLEEKEETKGWTTAGNGLWIKPTLEKFHFSMPRESTSVDKALGLFVGYIELKEDGTPADNAKLFLQELKNDELIDFTLIDLKKETPYAIVFIHNVTRTLKPSDLTIYMVHAQTLWDLTFRV